MKKILIASTALVAAGLMTTGTASASEKIKLQLGGFSKWWVVAKWNDSDWQKGSNTYNGALAAVGSNLNNVDVIGDNEIHFVGSTTLDNGMKVGVQVELEAGGHSDMSQDTIDASFAFVEGGFGKLIIGTHNNGTYLLHVMAPDAAGNWGEGGLLQSGVAVAQPTNVMGMPYLNPAQNVASSAKNGATTAIASDNKAEKITYVAPALNMGAFGTIIAGASYVPNLVEDNRYPIANSTEAMGAGMLYTNTIAGVGVKTSAGYVTYGADAGAGTPATSVAGVGRTHEMSFGTQLSYAGFTIGGSYRHVNTDRQIEQSNMGVDQGTSSVGTAWDAGIQYANGPYAVSFAYFHSQVLGNIGYGANDGQDVINIYQVSAKYTLGPGVDLLGSVGYASFDDETQKQTAGGDSNHNEGWAIMTGLSLAF
ncbi:MAG: porin [Actinomycetota bacterium]